MPKEIDFEQKYYEEQDRCEEFYAKCLDLEHKLQEAETKLRETERDAEIMLAQLSIVHEIFGGE